MPKNKKADEESELEEEVEEENLKKETEESNEDLESGGEIDDERFQEFIAPAFQGSGMTINPSLDQINAISQAIDLEQDLFNVSKNENQRENRGNYIEAGRTDYISPEQEDRDRREDITDIKPVAILKEIGTGIIPLTRQKFAMETETDKLRNRENERGEYITNIENVEVERHLPFEDPKRRYKEKPIR